MLINSMFPYFSCDSSLQRLFHPLIALDMSSMSLAIRQLIRRHDWQANSRWKKVHAIVVIPTAFRQRQAVISVF